MLVFGGVILGGPNAGTQNRTWRLTGALGTAPAWSEVTTAGVLPAARSDAAAAYDALSGRMIVFGGSSSPGNDTWVLAGGASPSSPADDNFGGSSLDPTRWSAFGNSPANGSVTQQNGRLEISLTAGGANIGVQGHCF